MFLAKPFNPVVSWISEYAYIQGRRMTHTTSFASYLQVMPLCAFMIFVAVILISNQRRAVVDRDGNYLTFSVIHGNG